MKKRKFWNGILTLLLVLVALLIIWGIQTIKANAQPNAFAYQAIIEDELGDVLTQQLVAVQIDIVTEQNTLVYRETHVTMTSNNGIVALQIGRGDVQRGEFANIDWGANKYYIESAVDTNGGSDFTPNGTTQLLSVPYALYAQHAANVPEPQPIPDVSNFVHKSVLDSIVKQLHLRIDSLQSGNKTK